MDLQFPTTAAKISAHCGGSIIGDADACVESLASIDDIGPNKLSFISQKKYEAKMEKASGGVLLVKPDLVKSGTQLTFIVLDEPQIGFAKLAKAFLPPIQNSVSPRAEIHETAKLGNGVSVGPFAVIEEGVTLGEGTQIGAHTYVGNNVRIGKHCQIGPRVTLYHHVEIRNRVKIHSGSVIGSDGFGFAKSTQEKGLVEVPQIGNVLIEDDVRIGALVTIDRAAIGTTKVGARTKIDDHVHIAHNCQIGEDCILCGFAALSGSVVLGDQVVLAGQVGLADHVHVGKGAILTAQSGTSTNLEAGETYFLSPAVPLKEALRIVKIWRKLPAMAKQLRHLEEKIHGDRK